MADKFFKTRKVMRKSIRSLYFLPFIILFTGCPVNQVNNMNADIIPDKVIAQIKTLDVYFEHASVGSNITDGLAALAASKSRYNCDRHTWGNTFDASWYSSHDGFGDNARGNPGLQQKISLFDTNMRSSDFANAVDVAMFKFCFIDTTGTAQEAFNGVRSVMDSLERDYPHTIFVWWTMPLNTTGDQRKDEYNKLVRDYCSANNKHLFDLADIESHTPESAAQTDASGREVLYGGYSSDGGHLNQTGSLRIANAWWLFLATLCGWMPGIAN
jgi:hypothetical protein